MSEARAQFLLGTRQAAALAAEREGRPDDGRGEAGRKLVEAANDDALRHRQTGRRHRVTEREPVLRPPDRLEVGADQLDSEAVEHAGLGELDRQVEGRLAPECRQERLRPLPLDDRRQRIGIERLDVRRVRPRGIGHDRRRIRVHEHDPVALGSEHAARLGTGVVELAGLSDPDRP